MFFVFEILPQICKSESEFLLDIWRSRYSFRMTKHPFNNFEGRIIGISGVCSVAEILSDALLMLTACIQINLSSVVYWVGPFHSPSILRCNVQFYYSVFYTSLVARLCACRAVSSVRPRWPRQLQVTVLRSQKHLYLPLFHEAINKSQDDLRPLMAQAIWPEAYQCSSSQRIGSKSLSLTSIPSCHKAQLAWRHTATCFAIREIAVWGAQAATPWAGGLKGASCWSHISRMGIVHFLYCVGSFLKHLVWIIEWFAGMYMNGVGLCSALKEPLEVSDS